MSAREITLSVVSHRQNGLVNQLLGDLRRACADRIALVLTQNVPDPVPFDTDGINCPVEVIVNSQGKGFAANHNAAFSRCRTPYFCVCNPDIRLSADPFPALLQALEDSDTAVAGPLVRAPDGRVEDSARRFPTTGRLLRKLLSGTQGPDYPTDGGALEVDWVGGMFMLFRAEAYRAVDGFDEAYFLYYEDVDLCHRLRAAGRRVVYEPGAAVTHDARRASRRDPALALHHARSALRFLSRR